MISVVQWLTSIKVNTSLSLLFSSFPPCYRLLFPRFAAEVPAIMFAFQDGKNKREIDGTIGMFIRLFVILWAVARRDSPARTLEWVAMPSSRGSSQPRD